MKHLSFILFHATVTILVSGIVSIEAKSQTQFTVLEDLTSKIANADFKAGSPVQYTIRTYDYDIPDQLGFGAGGKGMYGQQEVIGWTAANPSDNKWMARDTRTDGSNGRAAGVFAYDIDSEIGLGGDYFPCIDGGDTQGLGMMAVWGATISYTQHISLPAGDYLLIGRFCNIAGEGTINNNFGFKVDDETYYRSSKSTYPIMAVLEGEGKDIWVEDTVIFRLSAAVDGDVVLGFSYGGGSGSVPHLFLDNVKLLRVDPSSLILLLLIKAKATLKDLIDEGKRLYVDTSASEVVYNNANATLEQVEDAIEKQKALNSDDITDLSEFFIMNPHFTQDDPITDGVCTYDYDMARINVTHCGMQPVKSWVASNPSQNQVVGDENIQGRACGVFETGSSAFLGGTAFTPPATLNDGSKGNVLGFLSCWSKTTQYTQHVTLPAGSYTLIISYYNSGGMSAVAKNLIGFITDGGTEFLGKTTSFPVGTWGKETVVFTIDEETEGEFSLGYTATNSGSASMPHLFVNGIKIATSGMAGINYSLLALQKQINTAKEYLGKPCYSIIKDELIRAIDNGQSLIDTRSSNVGANNDARVLISDILQRVIYSVSDYERLKEFYDYQLKPLEEKHQNTIYVYDRLVSLDQEIINANSNGLWDHDKIITILSCIPDIFQDDIKELGLFFSKINDYAVKVIPIPEIEGLNKYSGNIVIPSSIKENNITYQVTAIDVKAFELCTALTSIAIPNSITDIGADAFKGCDGLRNIDLHTVNVGSWFRDLAAINNVTFGDEVESIGAYSFQGCSGLRSVIIPKNVTTIGSSAFSDLLSLTIDCSTVGESWFYGYASLRNVRFTEFVKTISSSAFKDCSNLSTIIIPDNVTSIGDAAFENCPLKSLVIGAGVLSIGDNAFSHYSNFIRQGPTKVLWLTNTPPEGYRNAAGTVNYVANDLYTSLSSKTIYPFISSYFKVDGVIYVPTSPSDRICDAIDCTYDGITENIIVASTVTYQGVTMSVKNVHSYSFYGNDAICSLMCDIEGIVGDYAFCDCSKMVSLRLGGNISSIEKNVFKGCTGLKNLIFEERDEELKMGSTLSNPIFADCPLDSVFIGRNITYETSSSYSYSPFYGNLTLRTVVFTDYETAITEKEFYGCSNLQNLIVGEGVTKLGDWALSGCSSLQCLQFGAKMESIGKEAFSDCTSLTKIVSRNPTPPSCGLLALDDINKWKCTLIVPKGSLSAYQNADQWKEFFFIEEGEESFSVVITANSYTRVYGDDNPSFEYSSFGTALTGTPEITCEATSTSPVGTYPIVIKKGCVTNDNDSYINGTLTITKAPLTIKAGTYTKKQGEKNPEFTLSYIGFKNNETASVLTTQPTVTTTAVKNSPVGEYEVVVSGGTAQNYDLNYMNGKLVVTEANAVIIIAKDYTRMYGDANPTFDYSSIGAELNGRPEITCEATVSSPVGTYPIVIKKGSVTNFNDTYVNGTLTITKAPLTVSVEDASIVQGENIPTFLLKYSGFRNGDTESTAFTAKPSASTIATSNSLPGTYPIVVSGGSAQNYALTYQPGTLTIILPDGIDSVFDDQSETWYTIDGKKLDGVPNRKGIYIVNGRKVIIK